MFTDSTEIIYAIIYLATQVCCQCLHIRHQILEFTIEYYVSKTFWLVIIRDETDTHQSVSEGDTDLWGQSTHHGNAFLAVTVLHPVTLLMQLGVQSWPVVTCGNDVKIDELWSPHAGVCHQKYWEISQDLVINVM